jgi:hypothetical protein
MDSLLGALGFALRALRRRPAFAATAILSLGIAIGIAIAIAIAIAASTAVFTLVNQRAAQGRLRR